MNRSMIWLLPAAILVLALACGGKDEPAATEAPAAEAAAPAEAPEESAAAPAAQAESDPVADCKASAARSAWAEALDACTQAHALHPDDLALEHALQQAQAAAGE
jgi:hypothetical protein